MSVVHGNGRAIENKALILDLMEWVGTGARPYAEVMEAWRTSCPRLPIWEDAVELGFVACRVEPGLGSMVEVTATGAAFLAAERPGRC